MITEEHLLHWLGEMKYQLTGLRNELNKKEFKDITSTLVNDGVFSFEYAREKADTILRIINGSIESDMRTDGRD
jgi:hypothetical protein